MEVNKANFNLKRFNMAQSYMLKIVSTGHKKIRGSYTLIGQYNIPPTQLS